MSKFEQVWYSQNIYGFILIKLQTFKYTLFSWGRYDPTRRSLKMLSEYKNVKKMVKIY